MSRPAFASDVTRERFELVRERLEHARRKTRPRLHDLYDIFCAIQYLLHHQCSWRSLPPEFPRWRTVHEYFTQWSLKLGDGRSLLEAALETVGDELGLENLKKMPARQHR